jgi:uncharacterized protein (TIGR04255 family)
MLESQQLRRAPITEAVIDLRVDPRPDITVDSLILALEQNNNLGYTKKGLVISGEFGFSLAVQEGAKPVAAGRTTTLGVRLHSPDEKYVAQLSIEGFTLSRLQPYESWENLVLEAQRLWTGYLSCHRTRRITRAGTRYINNLQLPPTPNLERYLALQPALPAGQGLPELMSSFLQRFVLLDSPTGATVIITQALDVASLERPLPVILDIDAFRGTEFLPGSREVWDYLEQLRRLKNQVFFGCLTEKAIELYL